MYKTARKITFCIHMHINKYIREHIYLFIIPRIFVRTRIFFLFLGLFVFFFCFFVFFLLFVFCFFNRMHTTTYTDAHNNIYVWCAIPKFGIWHIKMTCSKIVSFRMKEFTKISNILDSFCARGETVIHARNEPGVPCSNPGLGRLHFT